MANEVKVGDRAPEFELQDQHGDKVKLSDLRGQKAIIAFHPGAFTNVCSAEILDLELRKDELGAEGAQTVTISADAPASKAAWGKAIGAKETPLLADFWPHGEVAKQYGVFNEKLGMAERATFIVDEDGKVIWKKVYDMHDVPDLKEVKGALRS